jgi:hypothetical protein
MQQQFTSTALIIFGQRLVESDTALQEQFLTWLGPKLSKQFASSSRNLFLLDYKFDSFIIERADRVGPSLLESEAVRHRLREWHYAPDLIFHDAKSVDKPETGLSLLTRFSAALVRSADRRRKDTKVKTSGIDKCALWWELKVVLVRELQTLQNLARGKKDTWAELRALIMESPETYKHLIERMESLECFATAVDDPASGDPIYINEEAITSFLSGEIRAGGFFDRWGAFSEHLDVEHPKPDAANEHCRFRPSACRHSNDCRQGPGQNRKTIWFFTRAKAHLTAIPISCIAN